jgi:hypothetical protein
VAERRFPPASGFAKAAYYDPVFSYVAWLEDEPEPRPTRECRGSQVVYFARVRDRRLVKIGTTADVELRQLRLRELTGFAHDLIGVIDGGKHVERVLLERFTAHHIVGEWFSDEIVPDLEALVEADRRFFGDAA